MLGYSIEPTPTTKSLHEPFEPWHYDFPPEEVIDIPLDEKSKENWARRTWQKIWRGSHA